MSDLSVNLRREARAMDRAADAVSLLESIARDLVLHEPPGGAPATLVLQTTGADAVYLFLAVRKWIGHA